MDNTQRKQPSRISKPLFIQISDTHYSLNNKDLADSAWRAALDKAIELKIPLIDAGDITNDKAIIRAEVANILIKTMKYANSKGIVPYLLVGNHSLCNEKGSEHALEFLEPYCTIISSPVELAINGQYVMFIPYQNTTQKFQDALQEASPGSIVVCHQGVQGAFMGDYVQDKTSIDPIKLEGHRFFSGHYHKHQTVGTLTYGGSPFTHSFGEANDGSKGYIVVNDDGTFERVILNLRKHVILNAEISSRGRLTFRIDSVPLNQNDLLWLKISGPQSELNKIDKEATGQLIGHHSNYKLDLIPTNNTQLAIMSANVKAFAVGDILDKLIVSMAGETNEQIEYLQQLWRDL
jgi:DNA repair exonuclease SbcCD nuclease subunit